MRSVVACLLLAAVPGCFLSQSTVNQPFDPALLAGFEPGVTQAQEVAEALGAPSQVVELGNRSAWLFEHVSEKQSGVFLLLLVLRGVDVQADRVWAFFDEQGTLTHLSSSFQAVDAEYDVPIF